MALHATTWLCGLGLLAAVTATASIAFAAGPTTAPTTAPAAGPSPDLTPTQVVTTIVAALKANDDKDAGIRTTFAFASPANQAATGPIDNFIPLVKNAAYAPLLNCQSASVREVTAKDDQAAELVTVTAKDGSKAYYLFQMSKQKDAGKLKDCWMTDGVIRVQPKAGGGETA